MISTSGLLVSPFRPDTVAARGARLLCCSICQLSAAIPLPAWLASMLVMHALRHRRIYTASLSAAKGSAARAAVTSCGCMCTSTCGSPCSTAKLPFGGSSSSGRVCDLRGVPSQNRAQSSTTVKQSVCQDRARCGQANMDVCCSASIFYHAITQTNKSSETCFTRSCTQNQNRKETDEDDVGYCCN